MWDRNRVVERKIEKESTPIVFEQLGGRYSYQEICSKEMLKKVLSYLLRIEEYGKYAGKTVCNNVYMDVHGKKTDFRRTRLSYERSNIFASIQRYAKKKKPDYEGKVFLETIPCCFRFQGETLENYRFLYEGKETYAFILSDKDILSFYLECVSARKEAVFQEGEENDYTETEMGMADLSQVREVLFQALLLDDLKQEEERIYANFYSIFLLE